VVSGSDRHLVHGVLFYDFEEEFLATVVPFVRTGLEFDEGVLLACPPRTQAMLSRELGDDRRIAYLAYDKVYTTPGAAIATYRELLDGCLAAGLEHVRVVGDTVAHSDRETRAEWGRYEAVVNDALQSYPVSALCTYDTHAVPDDALGYGRLTHPVIVSGGHTVTNADYVSPADYLRRTTRVAPDPLESTEPDLAVEDITSLEAVRGRLKTALTGPTHAVEPAADFVLAVNEVTTNAVRHGHPPYRVRVWLRPDRFLATVTDHGHGVDDPFAGYEWPGRPHGTPTAGMGLWLARRLCDRVDMFRGPAGFTVRLLIRPRQRLPERTTPGSPQPHRERPPSNTMRID
jgi:anti-sigma regulatory factor (Ser/Thr protein kinase)